MPSDTKFFEQPPRAVSSAWEGGVLVVTFHYHDAPDHVIRYHTAEETHQAQMLADRLRVDL